MLSADGTRQSKFTLKMADMITDDTAPLHEASGSGSTDHEESKSPEIPRTTLPNLEERLADEVRLRMFTEQVLDSRQKELESQESEKRALENEVEELRKELSHTQGLLAEARSQARSKDKKLLDARDQIFRLQPTREDITEADAIDAYRGLCSSVRRWVENRMKPILDDLDSGKLRSRPPPLQATRFASFVRDAASRSVNVDQSDVYHVISIIMYYLCLVFFSKSFYCPMDDYEGDSTLEFINNVESALARLPRGASDMASSDGQ